jgi:hypothetical protein
MSAKNKEQYVRLYFIIYNIKFDFRADIGLIGLAVMGQNLILNMNDNGFTVNYWFKSCINLF